MPFAMSLRGERIAYRVVDPQTPSNLPPLVLVQGLGLSGRFWFDMPERVAEHPTQGRRVIVLDNVGTGRSDTMNGFRSIGSMGDDIIAVLDDVGEASAVVCGVSMGGMISQEAALRHPRRIRGLILIATTPGFPLGRPPGAKALAALVRLPFEDRGGGRIFRSSFCLGASGGVRGNSLPRGPKRFASTERRRRSFFASFSRWPFIRRARVSATCAVRPS